MSEECEYHHGTNPECPMCWTQYNSKAESSFAAPAGSETCGETQRNRYGYLLDDLRQPKCPHCGKSTNKAYREVPNLKCWNCGREMTPNTQLKDPAKEGQTPTETL